MKTLIKSIDMCFSPGCRYSALFILTAIFLAYSFSGCAGGSSIRKERAVALKDMGQALVKQGDTREGLSYLLQADALDPNNPQIQHDLACAYAAIDEYDLSLQRFKKAIALKPDFSEATNNMGILYSKMKDWDNAMACFKKVASDVLYKTPHFAYHNMGLVYYYKGDYTSAIENYQKAIKYAPSYANVYYDLAASYEALNRNDEAVEAYKKAALLNPDYKQIDLSLARLYIKMGRKQDAKAALNKIIEADPKSKTSAQAADLLEGLK